jgi:hypothetical protein
MVIRFPNEAIKAHPADAPSINSGALVVKRFDDIEACTRAAQHAGQEKQPAFREKKVALVSV